MQPKQPNYGKHALQAFVIFGGGHLLLRGPFIVPWMKQPAGWPEIALSSVEWGILGIVIVFTFAWISYKLSDLRSQP
jgi:hypothetical protein